MIDVTAVRGDEDDVIHYGAIRIRAVGAAQLRLNLKSLDGVQDEDLIPLTLSTAPGRSLTRLSNFKSQKCYLTVATDEIDEYFDVNKIIVFIKPLWTSYPNG